MINAGDKITVDDIESAYQSYVEKKRILHK